MMIQTAFQEFLITQQLRGNSPKTLEHYRRCILPLLDFLGPDTSTQQLTLKQLRNYALTLHQRNLTSNSIKTYIKGIKAFLTWMYEEEYTTDDLSKRYHLPKAQRKTIDVLTLSEIDALFKSFDLRNYLQLRNYCICALMLDSGLRRHEVVSLSLPDLHITEGYAIVNGKGNKQRFVPLGFRSRKYLIKYVAQRPADIPHSFVFLTKAGTPITDATIHRLFKTLKGKEVPHGRITPRIHAHLLRHTFATSYLENGGNIYNLQMILGHTTLDMVQKYVHLTQAKTVVNFTKYSPLDNLPQHTKSP